MTTPNVVVVGGGVAAVECIETLRTAGWTGSVTLISNEAQQPYQRPPLSKALFGRSEELSLPLRSPSFYLNHDVELKLGSSVMSIDREHHSVDLSCGERIEYSHLVLGTGSRPRTLDIPGSESARVHYLRGQNHARTLHHALDGSKKLVLIGGGFIGLEVAACAVQRGITTTVLERNSRLLCRAVSAEMSAWIHAHHQESGLSTVFETNVSSIEDSPTGSTVITTDGRRYDADVVLVGIGGVANDELARSAGLATSAGIVVDRTLATADPRVWAVGDCARIVDTDGTSQRIESVQNATDQGRHVARNIMAREAGDGPSEYAAVPWFWSNQGSLKLQIAGSVGSRTDADSLERAYPRPKKYSVLRFAGSQLVAVESVNSPGDHLAARALLSEGTPVDRILATDTSVAMKTMLSTSA